MVIRLLHDLLVGGMNLGSVFLIYIIADNGIQRQSQGQQKRNKRQGNCDTFFLRKSVSFLISVKDYLIFGRKNVGWMNNIILKNN